MLAGLTGGVASGKTLVSEELVKCGAHLVDADRIAREILAPGGEAFLAVVEEFGKEIVTPEGIIDRKALGAIVFDDAGRLARLNELTHPLIIRIIRERIEAFKESDPTGLVVVDAPLLIEVGLDKEMDAVVVVYADECVEVERLQKRNGLGEDEAKRMIRTQIPLSEKIKRADHIVENSGSVEETLKAARKLYVILRAG